MFGPVQFTELEDSVTLHSLIARSRKDHQRLSRYLVPSPPAVDV